MTFRFAIRIEGDYKLVTDLVKSSVFSDNRQPATVFLIYLLVFDE